MTPPPLLSLFLQIQKVKLGLASLKVYRVKTLLHSIMVAMRSSLEKWSSHLPTAKNNIQKILVSIPAPILESVLLMLVWQLQLGMLSVAGVVAVACLLIYEHGIVKADDLSRVNAAFFTMNGWVSVLFFVFWAADILLLRRHVMIR